MDERKRALKEVKARLSNRRYLAAGIANRLEQARMLEKKLESAGAPSQRYGDDAAGGFSELTPTESGAEDRIKTRKRIEELMAEVESMKSQLKQIDRALSSLKDTERRILKLKYMDGLQWVEVADEIGCVPLTAQRKAETALLAVWSMIGGQ